MKTILICGSRDCTPEMRQKAATLIMSATLKDECQFVVGDAVGIDDEVVRFLTKVAPSQLKAVYGITAKPRNGAPAEKYIHLQGLGYYMRDAFMVEQADEIIGIWNGRSNGTRQTCRYAVLRGKPTRVLRFPLTPPSGRTSEDS